MRIFRFIPTWRGATESIALIEAPDAGWFAPRAHARFTLLCDGSLLFGDGATVLHKDICLFTDALRGGTLMAGSFVRIEGVWVAYCVQYFAAHGMQSGPQDRVSLRLARALLPRLDFWQHTIAAMGNDPIADSTRERIERNDDVPEEWEHEEPSSFDGAASSPTPATAQGRGIRRSSAGGENR